MPSARVREFQKCASRAALVGALAGAGKWGYDLPKLEGKDTKTKLRTLLLDVGGGAALGGAAGLAARHGVRALRRHVGRGVRSGIEEGAEKVRKQTRWPLSWFLRK
jgi:hypothetical protein